MFVYGDFSFSYSLVLWPIKILTAVLIDKAVSLIDPKFLEFDELPLWILLLS